MNGSSGSSGAIVGRIVDANGRSIPEAGILMVGDSPPHEDIAALTNVRGEYRLDGLAPGLYTLMINAQSHARTLIQVKVIAGQTSDASATVK